jgi:hypothetical protein
LKSDFRLSRNYLKGAIGDPINLSHGCLRMESDKLAVSHLFVIHFCKRIWKCLAKFLNKNDERTKKLKFQLYRLKMIFQDRLSKFLIASNIFECQFGS